jgi:hypothetical protein
MYNNKLNILELHRTLNEKKLKKNQCYDKVLEICHKKIIHETNNYKVNCFYEIPLYIFGYPIFDISLCIEYIKNTLENEGFLVKYFFPKYLYISWDFEEINQIQEKPKIKINNNYDPLLSINTRIPKKLNFCNKQSNLSYKPSGKLQLNLL